MSKQISAGTIKRLHVDKGVLASNRKHGTNRPPLTIQHSSGSKKAFAVTVKGPCEFKYRPEKPLSCGAVAWVETRAEVVYK